MLRDSDRQHELQRLAPATPPRHTPDCSRCHHPVGVAKRRWLAEVVSLGARPVSKWQGDIMRFSFAAALILALGAALSAQDWTDPSPHTMSLVPIRADVRLEMLDWGGTGRPVVLLAGLGHTAHIFDDFALKLTPEYHVYGLTRRGFGASSAGPGGYYGADQLANDVASAIVAAKLDRPVVIGHFVAAEEPTSLGADHPQLGSGLVYLDGPWDRTNRATGDTIAKKLPQRRPSDTDMRSIDSFRSWIQRTAGISLPEAEARQAFQFSLNGRFIGSFSVLVGRPALLAAGVSARDYERVQVPALAFYAVPRSIADMPGYRASDITYQEAFEEMYRWQLQEIEASKRRFTQGVRRSSVVELPGASHYVFLSHEREIIAAVRKFVSSLE
jgi:non-heme chloroperoxidase